MRSSMRSPRRFRGALLGLAVGDAVGTIVEFQLRGQFNPLSSMVGGGPFQRHRAPLHRVGAVPPEPRLTLNLRAASRKSMILLTRSTVGFAPQFLKKSSGNAQVSNRVLALFTVGDV